ncbi:MAG TPA: hypothetical protein VIJ49_05770 [Aestuariivirga sp.]
MAKHASPGVWAVRHIIKMATGRMVTNVDGTGDFAPQLKACFGKSFKEADVPAGSIIISPTEQSKSKRNIGHLGLVGDYTGDDSRLIYSNSSADALSEQNKTLKSWKAHYQDEKGLEVLFFPVPNNSIPMA